MGILNVTPDSFSDGGRYLAPDAAIRHAEKLIADGADILDVGGESTRPGSESVPADEEIARVVPVIQAVTQRFDTPVSIDTWKAEIAAAALDAGAEIVNDISGLRFDPSVAAIAAQANAGLILMHSLGEFETMHTHPPVDDIFAAITDDFRRAVKAASEAGVTGEQIVLDVGIGFGKTLEQNLALVAKLDKLISEFPDHPMLVGTSRKSFIGKILDGAPANDRLAGSLATVAIALWNGASIIRAHDVAQTRDCVRLAAKLLEARLR